MSAKYLSQGQSRKESGSNFVSRSFCWTWWGGASDLVGIPTLAEDDAVRYSVVQIEDAAPVSLPGKLSEGLRILFPLAGGLTGEGCSCARVHAQGYTEFSRSVTANRLLKMIPGAHIEKRRGTRDEARNYCMKPDTQIDGPYETGSWEAGGQGSNENIVAIKKKIDEGGTLDDVREIDYLTMLRYRSALSADINSRAKPRDWDMDVRIYWGVGDSGKSHDARAISPDSVYVKDRTQYWNGYSGQHTVVIEEYTPEGYPFLHYEYLKQLCDKYQMQVNPMYGSVQFNSKVIVFTSNYNPMFWWRKPDDQTPFFSRVDEIKEYTVPHPLSTRIKKRKI